jgi:zona occludens toxin (predicted ATPase)
MKTSLLNLMDQKKKLERTISYFDGMDDEKYSDDDIVLMKKNLSDINKQIREFVDVI